MMNSLWQVMLATYYYSTLPYRNWKMRSLGAEGMAPVMVLFYHRIADTEPNDWTMGNRQFRQQILWLREHFEMVSLPEAQRRMREGNSKPAVSITFDDGYAENCQQALPLLVELDVPVTYFVTAHNILSGEPFPHDLQAGTSLEPNTVDQIRALIEQGVEIGFHTRSHPDLGAVRDRETLVDELITARDQLQQALDYPLRYFAFPYGQPQHLSREAFQLARDAHYLGVCSGYGGYNMPGEDPFHIERIHGDLITMRLKNWLTMDPRKLNQKPPYQDTTKPLEPVH